MTETTSPSGATSPSEVGNPPAPHTPADRAPGDRAPGVFDRMTRHEQVCFGTDRASGLEAIVAIYSTALGPALGGTRFFPYVTEADALDDVLALSEAMAYKAALAGLDLGGGKAVIIADPERDKTEPLLRAYGRLLQGFGGRYITACDVGTYSPDMDVIAEECAYVTGRTVANGGAGDSSVLTAYGVFRGMQAAAEHAWGSPTLAGRRIGIAGAGKVGHRLAGHLIADGARVVAADVSGRAIERLRGEHPEVEVVAGLEELSGADLDVYAPCALGHALDDATIARMQARIVCGAANNQLAHAGTAKALVDRGICYAPDYCVNAGGLIQVADEIGGFCFDRARERTATIFATTRQVLRLADEQGIPPSVAADRLAEDRLAGGGSRK